MRKIPLAIATAVLLVVSILVRPLLADSPVAMKIDAARPLGEFHPIWRFFGYDEANFTYMKDGNQLLAQLGQLGPQQVYIRAHHLLTSGDGTPALKWSSTGIYSEDAQGKPIYKWTIIDRIFDTYVAHGLKPYVEIGFMPKDLSTRPDLYPSKIDANTRVAINAGQAYPPKDYDKWRELIYQWTAHCVERYGKAEVAAWYWEVWNEPDISYWRGAPAEYYKLYDYAIDGVRRALPAARVGGPDSAGGDRFLRGFIEHCLHGQNTATGKQGSPLDFVSFHAKGKPRFVAGHVRMGLSNQLGVIDRNFAAIASFAEIKGIPIVIGESDPDGMAALPASEAAQNGYRTTTLFSSYEAEAFARTEQLAQKHGVNLAGALTWSFEFENKPYFVGFRVLSTNGINLPVFNFFKMYAKMGGAQVSVQSSADLGEAAIQKQGVRADSDVYAIAGLEAKKLSIMVWNYHDDDVAAGSASVDLAISGLPVAASDAKLTHYRIDQDHSNAFTVWKKLGSPQSPSADQYAQMQQAAQLATLGDPQTISINGGKAGIQLSLPRQAISLLVLEWK